jgi:hypothetical protein
MKSQGFSIRLNGIIGFMITIGILVLLFFILRGLFKLLYVAAPVLIILALIINYRTILNYFRFILGLLHRNPLTGIIAILLSVVGFPILSGVLFGKSILDRKVRRLEQAHAANEQGEVVDYEEVIRPDREDTLKMPPLEKPKPEPKENPYKDLF